ncbi:hypothetical protein ScPMuIL_015185 [Solemya velum]
MDQSTTTAKMADEDREEEDTNENMKPSSSLQQMLNCITEERAKDRQITISGEYELVPGSVNHFWTSLFSKYFLVAGSTSDDSRDDMLFYVRKLPDKGGRTFLKAEVEVFRKDSKKLPSAEIPQWTGRRRFYLNIILHQFEYTVTCALCTRTDEKQLQILKKFSQRVYPSPSRRRMDSKGTGEEIAYPNIFFTVDNFEEAFSDIVVRDSEMVCVELVASDREKNFQGVIFLALYAMNI